MGPGIYFIHSAALPSVYLSPALIRINTVYNYVTGFWKTDQIVTSGLFYFIGPTNDYTCKLHGASFAGPVNS